MSKHGKYMLVTWYKDESSDYQAHWSFETEIIFVSDKDLEDISKLMKDNSITQWVKDPETITEKTWHYGDGSLVEYRNLIIKPVKIVESWKFTSEVN